MMDGGVITNYASGGAAQSGSYAGIPIPNPDSIQEFKVQTSQYDAAYGQNPGANVNVVTKSGTNQFHGGVWEFNRNNFFNANDFFYKRSEDLRRASRTSRRTLKQNQYGGTLGGPIKKDKIFFFGSYQGTRQLNGIGSNGFATGLDRGWLATLNEPGVPFATARSDGNAGSIPQDFRRTGRCAATTPTGNIWDARLRVRRTSPRSGRAGQLVLPDGSNISNTAINLLRQTEKIPQAQGGFNNGYLSSQLALRLELVCRSAWNEADFHAARRTQRFRKPPSPMKIST